MRFAAVYLKQGYINKKLSDVSEAAVKFVIMPAKSGKKGSKRKKLEANLKYCVLYWGAICLLINHKFLLIKQDPITNVFLCL